jgi:hypothetical protein
MLVLLAGASGLAPCMKEQPDFSNPNKACVDSCANQNPKANGTACSYQKEVNLNSVFCECIDDTKNCGEGLGADVNVVIETHTGECLSRVCTGVTKTTAAPEVMKLALWSPCMS